ncbi:hypothetical protein NB311A_00590 [Nitrobacter sp. Nb-311A]|uniref:baeRF11 domain-containing protein n=1 Tax=unclassified Nitrobacter TaxID=2620411 RepID=UPI0000685489|nr:MULTISPECIES: hypothetical protein [unclassified Nitrobacter]EAQ34177.1 hypothetical protein NB311A_00590 [Nitrobacter sp. Nb-311A]MCB1393738.1 hypothetical protein [Nitrobacter sp.]
MLYVDIPALSDLRKLNDVRADACVSIYVPTTPLTQDVEASRIEAGNLAKQAYAQLEAGGLDKRRLALLAEQLDDLLDDDEFWRFQARSLAIFATPDTIQTFRLANRLQSAIEVADRFLLKPLMRAITFPNEAFVLAISENNVRLIEVFPDLPPQRLQVPDLPKDAASAVKVSSLNNRTSLRRVMGSEGQKVRLAQYSRMVDAAIRPILAGRDVPLILAANEPVAAIFRSINSNPNLVPETLTVTDDRSTESEIAAAARPILDAAYAREIEGVRALFEQRANDRRATTDISDAARLATFGGIETLLVNFDEIVHGTVDEDTGAVVFGEEGPDTYGIVDEIMRRALTSGARVIAARKNDIPGAGSLAATLRYPL